MRAPARSHLTANVFWFAAVSFAAVLLVFDSPALDYRLIMAGSLLPWLDFIWGSPWPMHSVFFPVAVMMLVMILGWGRRLWQRRWLCLAIGLFMHLVLAATWSQADVFWWPALGAPESGPPTPSPSVALVLEVGGLCVAIWLWRMLGFGDRSRRAVFARTGRIDRSTIR